LAVVLGAGGVVCCVDVAGEAVRFVVCSLDNEDAFEEAVRFVVCSLDNEDAFEDEADTTAA
jgi:hypothetical protein